MKVFISHAHADSPLARRIADALRASGFQVWDESQLLPGDNWAAKVGEALEESQAMVIVLTAHAIEAANIRYELEYALGKKEFKGRVVSVLAAPPDELPEHSIPWVLRRLRMVNFTETGPEEGVRQVAEALKSAA